MAEFAYSVAMDANSISENDKNLLEDAGFTDEDLVEILGVIGHFNEVNVYASALNAEPADRDDILPRYLDLENEDLDALAKLWKHT